MAKQPLLSVDFRYGYALPQDDGRKKIVSRVTNQDGVKLSVDEELGVLYVGELRFSVHSDQIANWRVFAPPTKKV